MKASRLAEWKKARAKAKNPDLTSENPAVTVEKKKEETPEGLILKPVKKSKRTFGRLLLDDGDAGVDHTETKPGNSFLPSANVKLSQEPKRRTLEVFLEEYDAVDKPPSETIDSDSEQEAGPNYTEPDLTRALESLDKRKDVPIPDFSELKPYKKQFYKQLPELEALDVEEIRSARGIQVSGSDLRPVNDWHETGLPSQLMDVIHSKKFGSPTPVQAQAIPIIMSGDDLLGIAPTGSGKTVAFLLPACRHAVENPTAHPSVVIIAPTRELAAQISSDLDAFAKALGLEYCCAAGGTSIAPQISKIKSGNVSIVVGTPGRIIDLLAANNGRVLSFKDVSMLILDETDRMLDMGFEPQVQKIIQAMRPDRQSILFSATMSRRMRFVTSKVIGKMAVSLVVGAHSTVPSQVTQEVEVFDSSAEKFSKLLTILGKHFLESRHGALVFVNTQEAADSVTVRLVNKGYRSTSLHGGKAQEDRNSAVEDFKNANIDVLVATSVAARGLDVADLGLVVNFDPPNHIEDYVHRAGRTGRAGNVGRVVTFIVKDQGNEAHDVALALRKSGLAVPENLQLVCNANPSSRRNWGFGGAGLSRLEIKREDRRLVEGAIHGGSDILEGELKRASPDPSSTPLKPPAVAVVSDKNGTFSTSLEINNYPREARMAVTNPGSQAEIVERYGVTMSGKGTFNGPSNDRLRILIEGQTETAVNAAYRDMSTLLVDAMAGVLNGKYSI